MALIILCLGGALPAHPADPIPEIPDVVPQHARAGLEAQRQDLVDQYAELAEGAEKYNRSYEGLPDDHPDAPAGRALYAKLESLRNRFSVALGEFRQALTKAEEEALARPLGPGDFSDDFIVRSARERQKKLLAQKERLQGQLAMLARQKQGLRLDNEEFEKLRAEAQIDLVRDVLFEIPATKLLRGMNLKGYLSGETADQLSVGFAAFKTLVNLQDTLSATDAQKAAANLLKARKNLKAALVAPVLAKMAKDDPARRTLETLDRLFDAAASAEIGVQRIDQLPDGERRKKIEILGRIAIDFGLVCVPQMQLIKPVDALLEKAGTQYILDRPGGPLDSLGAALSANWNAERYLSGKLEVTDHQLQMAAEQIERGAAMPRERRTK